MQPFAPLGRIVDFRHRKCGHSPGDNPSTDCPADATWHIMWNTDREVGLACDPHMDVARRYVFVDSHRIGPDCAMPGALWEVDGQRCVYPDEPSGEAAAATVEQYTH
ncbi:hypothetical protein [Streptomyces tendae]|uniref:hypothetical protein n=1 Tax=Streptomyces tendae TaxID=1932 RepID=UPI003665A3D1